MDNVFEVSNSEIPTPSISSTSSLSLSSFIPINFDFASKSFDYSEDDETGNDLSINTDCKYYDTPSFNSLSVF